MKPQRILRFFNEIGLADVAVVGGKNASLGEMYRTLSSQGVRVPNGFATTAEAYRETLDQAGAWPKLRATLQGLDPDDVNDLARRAAEARRIIHDAPLPDVLASGILEAYAQLREEYGPSLTLAVRSSATAEDLPTASFAGQHESFLNVQGDAGLLDAVKRCFASLFTDRAIRYRIDHGFDHFKVFLSVGVMKLVRADTGASGVMFSLDTETGFRDVVLVTGTYGLGETIVQGAVDPDEYFVFKPTLAKGHRTVLRRTRGSKAVKMILDDSEHRVRTIPTSAAEQAGFCLTDEEVVALAEYAVVIERHYSALAGEPRPIDAEWAKDGEDGKLYVVQARPETVASRRPVAVFDLFRMTGKAKPWISGHAIGQRIAAGPVRVIRDVSELSTFQPGDVLVADTTTPDWGTVMQAASAIVTNRGGRTCHAAILARELGVPAVVGTGNATETLATGDEVTVSCAEGDVGAVYKGRVPFESATIDATAVARPKTKIMVNIGNPGLAFRTSFLPNDGVGLARMEFIISDWIKVHPLALVHPERIEDPVVRRQLDALTKGYAKPTDFFVERLAEGIGTIAAAFYPKPVIVRLSDFKTNEYAHLLGGGPFEPAEENPMLGFRGAARYAHPAYVDGFALECAAIKRVREAMGLTNVIVMIPFCRRVAEAVEVIAQMAKFGLQRGDQGLELYMMCEIPNNVILIDRFAEHFDGFSIGSNDLTQLTLGVDRDSEIVAFDYDERDEGVLKMISMAIHGAHRNHRHIGICGQAPSDFPDFAAFLVREGIDSISLNPDAVLTTIERIAALERTLETTQGEKNEQLCVR